MVLTDKQKIELHQAIYDYFLSDPSFSKTAATLREEAGLHSFTDTGKGLLEKKWTSIVRLQKKVLELEAKVGSIGDETKKAPDFKSDGELSKNLPRSPAASVLSGHRGPITCVSIHPTYSLIASSSDDTTIKLWDYESAQYERTLKGHTGAVTHVTFSPSGALVASSSADMTAKIWDSNAAYQCTKTLRAHDHSVSSVQFLPSGDHVLTCSRDQTVKMWAVDSGFSVRTFSQHTDWVRCLSVSSDGAYFASGSSDQSAMVWCLSSPSTSPLQILRGHEHVVEAVSFGPRLVDWVALAASVSANTAGDSEEGGGDKGGRGEEAGKASILFILATGSRDRTIRLWDPLQGLCLRVLAGHENWVRGVAVHCTGKFVVSVSDDKSLRVFDVLDGHCVRTIANAHSHFVTCLCASPTNHVFATGSVDQSICIWSSR